MPEFYSDLLDFKKKVAWVDMHRYLQMFFHTKGLEIKLLISYLRDTSIYYTYQIMLMHQFCFIWEKKNKKMKASKLVCPEPGLCLLKWSSSSMVTTNYAGTYQSKLNKKWRVVTYSFFFSFSTCPHTFKFCVMYNHISTVPCTCCQNGPPFFFGSMSKWSS